MAHMILYLRWPYRLKLWSAEEDSGGLTECGIGKDCGFLISGRAWSRDSGSETLWLCDAEQTVRSLKP